MINTVRQQTPNGNLNSHKGVSDVFISPLFILSLCLAFLVFALMPKAQAQTIYKVVDETTGQVIFTDRPDSYQAQADKQVSATNIQTTTAPYASSGAAYPSSPSSAYPNSSNAGLEQSQSQSAQQALAINQGQMPPSMMSQPQPSQSADAQVEGTADAGATAATPNYQLRLLEPSGERAYRRPVQPIDVQLEVSPSLQATDNVVIYIDGQEVAQGLTASIGTVDMLPGAHQLTAVVVSGKDGDKDGENASQTHQVSQRFFVIQNTQAFQNKKRLAEQLKAYQQLPWYKKLYIKMRQDNLQNQQPNSKQNIKQPSGQIIGN